MNGIFNTVFPILFIVIGSLVAFMGLYARRTGNRSRHWLKTTGKVNRSWIEESSMSRSSSGVSRGGHHTSVKSYGPRIEYSYEADGKQYSNRQISAVVFRSVNRSKVEIFLRDYPDGAEIDVFYNPGKPSEACIIPGSNQGWRLFLLIGFIFAVIGVLILTGIIRFPD